MKKHTDYETALLFGHRLDPPRRVRLRIKPVDLADLGTLLLFWLRQEHPSLTFHQPPYECVNSSGKCFSYWIGSPVIEIKYDSKEPSPFCTINETTVLIPTGLVSVKTGQQVMNPLCDLTEPDSFSIINEHIKKELDG